jgi:hypothetical protein
MLKTNKVILIWKTCVSSAPPCMSLRCKVHKVGNHRPMWCLQVSNPHSSILKTEATCFYETLVFIYQATQCHIPGGHDLSRYIFLALKWKKNHFPESRCQHKAQIFTIRVLVKWNLLKGCSGQGGRDHQASQWHTSHGITAPQWHRSLCLIWISGLSAQDHKGAVVLQLVSVGCLHQSMTAFTPFIPMPRTIPQLNFLP